MKSVALIVLVLAVCHHVPTSAHHRDQSLRKTGNMDYYFDTLVVKIGHFFANNGLDPMPLPDMGRQFSFKDLIGVTWHGELMLKEVNVSGLARLHRSGEATLGYDHKLLDIQVELGFDDVKLDCDFVAEIMNIGPKGKVAGDIKNLRIYLDLKFDTQTFDISLQDLKITDAGKIDVVIHGHAGLLDLLVDAIADVVTTLFHDVVVHVIANQVRSVIEKTLAEINIDCLVTGNCTLPSY